MRRGEQQAHGPLPERRAAGEVPAIRPHHPEPPDSAQHMQHAHTSADTRAQPPVGAARAALVARRDAAAAAAAVALADRRVDRELPAALLEEVALLGAPGGAAS